MSLVVLTGPSEEPITLSDVKDHLRITDDDSQDILLTGYITAAREQVEDYLKRALITQTIEEYFDYGFPNVFYLERNSVLSVTSITYTDGAGSTQTVSSSDYVLDNKSQQARVYPTYGSSWPSPRSERNAVKITYQAGYGGRNDVPNSIKNALLLLVGSYDRNREATAPVQLHEIPFGIKSLLSSYRVIRF